MWVRDFHAVDLDKVEAVQFVVQYSRDQVAKWDSCVVWGKWRLVHGKELYDIAADRAQATDVAAQHPDVVKAMRDHYEAWWAVELDSHPSDRLHYRDAVEAYARSHHLPAHTADHVSVPVTFTKRGVLVSATVLR